MVALIDYINLFAEFPVINDFLKRDKNFFGSFSAKFSFRGAGRKFRSSSSHKQNVVKTFSNRSRAQTNCFKLFIRKYLAGILFERNPGELMAMENQIFIIAELIIIFN